MGRRDYKLVKVTAPSDWQNYHSLRREILWESRGRSGYDDKRPAEHFSDNHPLLLKLDGRPIGTTRLDNLGDGTGVVRLVTIASDIQRLGHGRILAAMVENFARDLGIGTLFVNADTNAVGYYEKMGWHYHVWDESELVGIAVDCKQMRKTLA